MRRIQNLPFNYPHIIAREKAYLMPRSGDNANNPNREKRSPHIFHLPRTRMPFSHLGKLFYHCLGETWGPKKRSSVSNRTRGLMAINNCFRFGEFTVWPNKMSPFDPKLEVIKMGWVEGANRRGSPQLDENGTKKLMKPFSSLSSQPAIVNKKTHLILSLGRNAIKYNKWKWVLSVTN